MHQQLYLEMEKVKFLGGAQRYQTFGISVEPWDSLSLFFLSMLEVYSWTPCYFPLGEKKKKEECFFKDCEIRNRSSGYLAE